MAAINLLSARNLSRTFGGLQAVDNVDFDIERGEIRAIIGPNGAGKTTFVSLLSGRIEATAGTVEFRGQDITRLPVYQRARRGIAYTFQITSIFPNLSVFDNVAIAVQNRFQASPSENAVDVQEYVVLALQQVEISHLQHERAGEIAYGHQRLLEVAMGLAMNPMLLILDEPTQGLSDGEIHGFCQLVQQINQTTTVLLIEHNMAVVMSLAHRITVLERGSVLAQGTPEEIQGNSAVQAAYLGNNPVES
jgi:branched-chain amino acid transport system ATP-binding protein